MKGKLEELSIDELDRSLRDSKEEIRKERFKGVTSKLDNPKKVRELKKHVARILTLKSEYRLGLRKLKVK